MHVLTNKFRLSALNPTRVKIMIRSLTVFALALFIAACEGGSSSSSGDTGNTGRGGSTARMTIDGDFLYAISSSSELQVFDIQQPSAPNPWSRVQVGWDIETLFPYGDYLLIGASSGMYIMDNRDRSNPQYLSEFTHATARDPVVAHEGYAYVTLRSENGFGLVNQMEVVDIRDISNPTFVKSVSMQSPSGLTVASGNLPSPNLYVCDDIAGIKIFDLTDLANPTVADSIPNVNCNDVLADRGILYVITDDSLIQYDYTQVPPVRLSTVSEEAG